MTNIADSICDSPVETLPTIDVPPSVRPSPEEIERRRIIVERIIRRRDEIGSIGISAEDLHHLAESETEQGE